jgi:uncharacterized protein YcgI (DUF1989 family)
MTREATLCLNQQQLELLDLSIAAGEAADRGEVVRLALRESGTGYVVHRPVPGAPTPEPAFDSPQLAAAPAERELIEEFALEPGTGRCVEVERGQLLRIEQVEGAQCVDFNCFNLHDYKEAMHTGRTRTLHGINPGAGDFLWSAPPRERALMFLATDTLHVNDVMFPRCSATLYESVYGLTTHTNCSDIQAEAQREYGLTPDDVHDSFNFFMTTDVVDGVPRIHRQTAKAGDHVELLALLDVLAVPNICGSDIMPTSNFSLAPVLVQRYRVPAAELGAVPALPRYRTQRDPSQFRQPVIRTERALHRDPHYEPAFTNTPIRTSSLTVALSPNESAVLERLRRPELYSTDGDALRDIVFTWWAASHSPTGARDGD